MRSRANSLPFSALDSWYFSAPPASTRPRRLARCGCPASSEVGPAEIGSSVTAGRLLVDDWAVASADTHDDDPVAGLLCGRQAAQCGLGERARQGAAVATGGTNHDIPERAFTVHRR